MLIIYLYLYINIIVTIIAENKFCMSNLINKATTFNIKLNNKHKSKLKIGELGLELIVKLKTKKV